MKSFHKFIRSHSDELKKFGTTLMKQRSSVRKEVLVEHILLNCIFISDVYVIYIFLFFFTVYCVTFCAHIFLFCCSRVLISLCCILTLDAYFILTANNGWLLLKWSTIGIGFNGAETNCRIAHVLGIPLMISY